MTGARWSLSIHGFIRGIGQQTASAAEPFSATSRCTSGWRNSCASRKDGGHRASSAGGVAHDFNNILTIILGHADVADDVAAGCSKTQMSAAQIKQASERAARLTAADELLAFGRKQIVNQQQPGWI